LLPAQLTPDSPSEEAKPGFQAQKADFSPLHISPELTFQGQTLHFGLGQDGPDVDHLVQVEVQRLEGR